MIYPAFVCLFVSLSVCLLATLGKTADRIFMKILPVMYLSLDKDDTIKF